MKLDLSPWHTGAQTEGVLAPPLATRGDWQQRQRARLRSIRKLAQREGRGLACSLTWTAALWLLLIVALWLAFKT